MHCKVPDQFTTQEYKCTWEAVLGAFNTMARSHGLPSTIPACHPHLPMGACQHEWLAPLDLGLASEDGPRA